MKIKKVFSYFLLLTFLFLLSNNNSYSIISKNHNSVSEMSVKVNPGKTISYRINSLSFDLNKSGINDQLEQINFDFSGDLSNSILYAKVLNIDEKLLSYWNPSTGTIIEGMNQIVEVASGIILSNPITLIIEGYEVELTAGAGFPISFLFNELTLFNLTGTSFDFLPLPLFLSDDWAAHESTIQLIANGLSVTNSPNEFTININQQDVAQQTETTGALTWRKDDGMFLKGSLNYQDSVSKIDFFNIDLLLREETNDLLPDVLTGDSAKIVLSDSRFDYLLSSSADISLIDNDLLSFQNDLADATGQTLLDLSITEIQGTKYKANIERYNANTKLLEQQEDFWFSSFGKYPQSALLSPLIDPFVSFGNIPNEISLGPFITPDWDIYNSWDQRLSSIQQISNVELEFLDIKSLFPSLINIQPFFFDELYKIIDKYDESTFDEINSGKTKVTLVDISLSFSTTDVFGDVYSSIFDVNYFIDIQHNWTDNTLNNHIYEATYDGKSSVLVEYGHSDSKTRLIRTQTETSMNYVWAKDINGVNQGVSNLTLTDFYLDFKIDYVLVTRPPPEDITTDTTLETTKTEPDTTEPDQSQPTSSSPGFTSSAPGFTIGLTLFSIMVISIVIGNRRRKQ